MRMTDGRRRKTWRWLALCIVIVAGAAAGRQYAQRGCGRLHYEETKVGDYTLPDPLLSKDGKRITDSASWQATRRSEILRDFRDLMYGHTPELPVKLRAELVATRKDALDGLATRTIVRLHLFDDP